MTNFEELDIKDEFYRDILGGLAEYYRGPLLKDLINAVDHYARPRLGHALNPFQIRSKLWLIDELHAATRGNVDTAVVLGGWYGTLSAMLFADARFRFTRIVSVDIEPECEPLAQAFNQTHLAAGRFRALTADMYELDLDTLEETGKNCVVINTSCEHLAEFDRWFQSVPRGTLLALQSNDYFDCDEHVNCVGDLQAFRAQAPLQPLLRAGELELKKYRRFLLIGYRP